MIDRLQYIGEHSFWPVWLILTTVALMMTALLVRRASSPAATGSEAPLPASRGCSRIAVAPLALSICFLTGYIAVVLVGEDFTAYDNAQFTMYSLRGIDFPNPIWRESGRFFPLGLQQFNFLGHLTRSPAGYHAFAVLEILILFAIILVLDEHLSIAARTALAVLALLLPTVLQAFMGLIYTECDVIFWIACVAVSVQFFSRTRSIWAALAAVFSAQFALYYKEPVFLFLLTFASVRIVLRAKDSRSLRAQFSDPEARLDFAIAAVSLAFVAFYGIVVLSHSPLSYLAEHQVSRLQTVRTYFRLDWLIWLFAAFTTFRMGRVIRGLTTPVLLWDGLACGAMVYFGAYLTMGIASEYYLAPADLIAALYLGRFLVLSWNGMRISGRVISAAVAGLVVLQILDWSTIRVVERKYVVQRKASVANVVVAMLAQDPGRVKRLYFPFTSRLGVADFAAYLNYRRVPVEEAGQTSSNVARIELYSAQMRQAGRCVAFHDFLCHAGPAPDGDLTIVFPDDTYPPSQFKAHHELEQKLLNRDPPSHLRALYFHSLDIIWSFADKLRPY